MVKEKEHGVEKRFAFAKIHLPSKDKKADYKCFRMSTKEQKYK